MKNVQKWEVMGQTVHRMEGIGVWSAVGCRRGGQPWQRLLGSWEEMEKTKQKNSILYIAPTLIYTVPSLFPNST